MNYFISRQGQQYGPYSLEDLRRYVAQGNIALTDLARGDGMQTWIPVSQILNAPARPPVATPPAGSAPEPGGVPPDYNATPNYGRAAPGPGFGMSPAAFTPPSQSNIPPGLHWALVLLFGVLTCSLFWLVWIFVEASYVRKLRPGNNSMLFYVFGFVVPFLGGILTGVLRVASPDSGPFPTFLFQIGGFVLSTIANFQMKNALEEYYNTEEPIGLRLSGVMTFFFAIFYFQYHFTRIRRWKLTGVLS